MLNDHPNITLDDLKDLIAKEEDWLDENIDNRKSSMDINAINEHLDSLKKYTTAFMMLSGV